MFDAEEDLGIAGRIAEALRRLGRSNSTHDFISRLPRYCNRLARDDHSPDLTFEIDDPLMGFDDSKPTLLTLLSHDEPRVRKHALILLMRLQSAKLDRTVFVRSLLTEFESLNEARAMGKSGAAVREHVADRSTLVVMFDEQAQIRVHAVIEDVPVPDARLRLQRERERTDMRAQEGEVLQQRPMRSLRAVRLGDDARDRYFKGPSVLGPRDLEFDNSRLGRCSEFVFGHTFTNPEGVTALGVNIGANNRGTTSTALSEIA